MRSSFLRGFVQLSVAMLLAGGCKGPSQLVVGVITNLAVKDQLDDVKMDILRNGVTIQEFDWSISNQSSLDFVLPGSFSLDSDEGGTPSVQVVVTGFKSNVQKVLRQSTIQLQSEGQIFYRMALVLACTVDNFHDTCPDGLTCVEGICKPDVIDPKTLEHYDSDMVTKLGCDSGSKFIDTGTCGAASIDPMTGLPNCTVLPTGTCESDEFCQEGTCYKRNTVAPTPREFGDTCIVGTDTCRDAGVVCKDTPGNPSVTRCRQSCNVDSDCTKTLQGGVAGLARCGKTGDGGGVCTFGCDPVSNIGCIAAAQSCEVITDDAAFIAPDCVDVSSSGATKDLGDACKTSNDCKGAALCVKDSPCPTSNPSCVATCRASCCEAASGGASCPSTNGDCGDGGTCSASMAHAGGPDTSTGTSLPVFGTCSQ